jgi:hypothetical protein
MHPLYLITAKIIMDITWSQVKPFAFMPRLAMRHGMKRLPQALVVAMPSPSVFMMKTKGHARASAPLRLDVTTG